MKERPILFSIPMMRAILNGSKTQMRQIMNPQPPEGMALHRFYGEDAPRPALTYTFGWFVPYQGDLWPANDEDRIQCPYLINQTLQAIGEKTPYSDFSEGDQVTRSGDDIQLVKNMADDGFDADFICIKAPDDGWCTIGDVEHNLCRRYRLVDDAKLTTLEIIDIRAERLNDIAVENAEAEGCKAPLERVMRMGCDASPSLFAEHWESLHGGGSWTLNPWVWVIEFRRVEQ